VEGQDPPPADLLFERLSAEDVAREEQDMRRTNPVPDDCIHVELPKPQMRGWGKLWVALGEALGKPGYWVAEQWDQNGEELNARWTTEVPGRTGPSNLTEILKQLREQGWRVYRT
jgi:hypothetical protein